MKGHFIVTVTGQGTGALRVLPRKDCPPGIREHLAEKLPPSPLQLAQEGPLGGETVLCSLGRSWYLPAWFEDRDCTTDQRRAERLPRGGDLGPVPGRMWSIHRHRMGRNSPAEGSRYAKAEECGWARLPARECEGQQRKRMGGNRRSLWACRTSLPFSSPRNSSGCWRGCRTWLSRTGPWPQVAGWSCQVVEGLPPEDSAESSPGGGAAEVMQR